MAGEGLLDFGSGALTGATTGFKLSGGNPWATGGGALAGGLLSLFGGSEQRGLERQANRQSLAQGQQSLRLGDLQISQAMREDRAAREAEQRRKMFGQLLGQWFANRGKQQPMGTP